MGIFLPSSWSVWTWPLLTSCGWEVCVASLSGACLAARGGFSANLLLGQTGLAACLLPAISTTSRTGARREAGERRESAVELVSAEAGGGLNVVLRQKRMGFYNEEEVVGLVLLHHSSPRPAHLFDTSTYSQWRLDAYRQTCGLQGLLLLFEPSAWCFNILFEDSNV